jgi:hypothetical protein
LARRRKPAVVDKRDASLLIQHNVQKFLTDLDAQLPDSIDATASAFVSIAITMLRSGAERDEIDLLLDIAHDTVEPERPRKVALRLDSAAGRKLQRMPAVGNA